MSIPYTPYSQSTLQETATGGEAAPVQFAASFINVEDAEAFAEWMNTDAPAAFAAWLKSQPKYGTGA